MPQIKSKIFINEIAAENVEIVNEIRACAFEAFAQKAKSSRLLKLGAKIDGTKDVNDTPIEKRSWCKTPAYLLYFV